MRGSGLEAGILQLLVQCAAFEPSDPKAEICSPLHGRRGCLLSGAALRSTQMSAPGVGRSEALQFV